MTPDDNRDSFSGLITTFTYEATSRLGSISGPDSETEPRPPAFRAEHDQEKRVFRITGPDGQTTEFHDRAVRFLVVEPYPETGQVEPIILHGKPKVIYLCREAGL
jgi:hypothetical protein